MTRLALLPLFACILAAQNAPETKPQTETPKPEAPKTAKVEAPKTAKVEAPKVDRIVGIVGNEVIRQSDVDASFAAMPPQQQQQIQMMPNGRERYSQNYVESRLIAAKARKDGMDKTEAFARKMALAQEQMLASEYLNTVGEGLRAKLQIKDEELKAYFEAAPERFKSPDKATARHILVATKPATDKDKGVSEEEAKAKVDKIKAELAKGRKFEDLVKEYTDDPGSKETGGIYKDFNPDQMVPEFAQAVRNQELNKVGEPVKTRYGFHLIVVESRTPGTAPKFEDAKEQVRQAMTPERQEKVWKEFLEGLKTEIPMVVGDAAEQASKMIKAGPAKAEKATTKKPVKGATK